MKMQVCIVSRYKTIHVRISRLFEDIRLRTSDLSDTDGVQRKHCLSLPCHSITAIVMATHYILNTTHSMS